MFGRHKPAFGAPPCGFSAQSAEQQLQIGLVRTQYQGFRRTFSPQTSLPGELPKGFPRSLTPFHGVSAARFSSRLLGAISQSSGGPATESRRLTSSAALFFAPPQERPGTHPNPASPLASTKHPPEPHGPENARYALREGLAPRPAPAPPTHRLRPTSGEPWASLQSPTQREITPATERPNDRRMFWQTPAASGSP